MTSRATTLIRRAAARARWIVAAVRTHGIGYVFRAPGNELRNPRLAATKKIRAALVQTADRLAPITRHPGMDPDDCLLFAFDLGASPVTFDFATFLAGAEIERRRRGFDGLFVVFIPGAHGGLRKEQRGYESSVDHARRQWRVRNVLIPLLAHLPSVRGYTMCATRDQAAALLPNDSASVVPSDFRVWLPRQPDKRLVHEHAATGGTVWPLLCPTQQGREFADQFLREVCPDRRLVVITIRQTRAAAERNSQLDEWRSFLATIDRRRFAPILVHDTESVSMSPPPELADEVFCDAARWNVEIRMALYDAAWLNLAVMHGPMELCWYNQRSRYVVFLPVGADPSSSTESIAEGGLRLGEDLGFATPVQHIVWAADRAEAIRDAFEQMSARIEAS